MSFRLLKSVTLSVVLPLTCVFGGDSAIEWDLWGSRSDEEASAGTGSSDIEASSIKFSDNIIPSPRIDNAIAAAGWSSERLADSRFFTFSVENLGEPVDLNRLEMAVQRVNANAPRRLTIRASRDGFTTWIPIYESELEDDLLTHDLSIDLSQFESLRSLSGKVEFRVYGGQHSSGSGVLALRNHSEAQSIRISINLRSLAGSS